MNFRVDHAIANSAIFQNYCHAIANITTFSYAIAMAKITPASEVLNILLTALIATTTMAIAKDAIAQPLPSPQPQIQQPQPQIELQPQSLISILGYTFAGLAAIWGVSSQLISKWGIASIDAKAAAVAAEQKAKLAAVEADQKAKLAAIEADQKQINQDLRQDVAINEAYMGQAIKSSDILMRLLETAMSNVFQSSRELKELFYLLLPMIEKNSEDINKSRIDNTLQFERLEGDFEAMISLKKDIIAALGKIERRENVDHSKRREGGDRREGVDRRENTEA